MSDSCKCLARVIRAVVAADLGMPSTGSLADAVIQLIKNEIAIPPPVPLVQMEGVNIGVNKTGDKWTVDATEIMNDMSGVQADVDVIGQSLLPHLVKMNGSGLIQIEGDGTSSKPYVISLHPDALATTRRVSVPEVLVRTLTATVNKTTEVPVKYYNTGKIHHLEFPSTVVDLNGPNVDISIATPEEMAIEFAPLHRRCVHSGTLTESLLYRIEAEEKSIVLSAVLPSEATSSVLLMGFSVEWLVQ